MFFILLFFFFFFQHEIKIQLYSIRLILINKIRQISQNRLRQGPKIRKLQEDIWLTVIIESFKFPPHFDLFCQINYFYELPLSYTNCPTQK